MGPIGSGKTTCCIFEWLRRAVQQRPSPTDNVRYSRMVTVRETYRDLERTVLQDWFQWFPKDHGKMFKWSGGASGEPGKHIITFPLDDGTSVHFEAWFVAMGDKSAEQTVKGFAYTYWYLNEADLQDPMLATWLDSRAGRYPPKIMGGPSWRGGWCDFNAPNLDNWAWQAFGENLPEDWGFFRQPGGLDEGAENLQNLDGGRSYYTNQVAGKPEWWIERMINNVPGHSRDGKPVYPEFKPARHKAKYDLEPQPGVPLIGGLDQGRNPALALCQPFNSGMRVLFEFPKFDIGVKAYAREVGQFLHEKQLWDFNIKFVADPAAFRPTDTSEEDDDVWAELFSKAIGRRVYPAVSDGRLAIGFNLRQEPIREAMLHDKFLVSTRCPAIIRGLTHTYRYAKIKNSDQFHHQPDKKSPDIHVCNALEYAGAEILDWRQTVGPYRKHDQANQAPRQVKTHFRARGF